MDITVTYLANELAKTLNSKISDTATYQEKRDHEVKIGRDTYEIQVHAFNLSTAMVVSSVALAVIGLISMQAGFVLAALFMFVRDAVQKNLAIYEVPEQATKETKEGHQFKRTFGFPAIDEGDQILANLNYRLGNADNEIRKWEPVAHKVFGHAVWMNLLPEEPTYAEVAQR